MSSIVRIPLHHIEQDGVVSANTYVEQGNLFTNNFYNVISGNHSYKLFFEIPSDAYKYSLGFQREGYPASKFFGYVVAKSDLVRHLTNHYVRETREDGTIWTYADSTEVTTYPESASLSLGDFYLTPSKAIEPADAGFNMNAYYTTVSPVPIESDEIGVSWSVSELNVVKIQDTSQEYFVINVTPWIERYETNYDSGYTRKVEQIYTYYNKWNTDSFELLLLETDIDLYATPIFPVNVYSSKNNPLNVAWELSNSINRSSEYLYAVSSTVVITDHNGDSITKTISGSGTNLVFDTTDLDDLSVGKCTVELSIESNYGTFAESTWEFDLVGESDAPEITNVTQNSYPTITWTSDGQISWEMHISNAQGIVYSSGIVVGSETSFTIPKLLEDGDYSIEIRCVNSYGVFSEWGSYFLQLNPTKPDAPEGIIVSARTDFGVSVSCSDMETTGKLLAVRRKDEDSEPVVLGEYNGTFVDYLIGLNDYHQYTIRNYVQGYADGEWIDGVVLASGVVIRNADDYSDFVNVWMSEDAISNYRINEARSDVLVQCIGRKFPVAERGEWITSTRSFNGFVTDKDFQKLVDMKLNSNHVLLQSNGEYFPCYMEFSDDGKYITDGRLLSFLMTRIDGDK